MLWRDFGPPQTAGSRRLVVRRFVKDEARALALPLLSQAGTFFLGPSIRVSRRKRLLCHILRPVDAACALTPRTTHIPYSIPGLIA